MYTVSAEFSSLTGSGRWGINLALTRHISRRKHTLKSTCPMVSKRYLSVIPFKYYACPVKQLLQCTYHKTMLYRNDYARFPKRYTKLSLRQLFFIYKPACIKSCSFL